MIFGIDASNIRAGGPVTHLIELLRAAEPAAHGFSSGVIWSSSVVLEAIDGRPWLRKVTDPMLQQSADPYRDRRHLIRAYWQRFKLHQRARQAGCDVLFVPGGLDSSGFHPMVTMSQNMLPFDWNEARRYGISLSTLRLGVLRAGQGRTFRRADGVIFLTEYARDNICSVVDVDEEKSAVVPHGIGSQFLASPREQRTIGECTPANPFRLLYVSTIDLYKHQWHVAEAVATLRREGLPVSLELVGAARGHAAQQLDDTLARLDPTKEFLSYLGPFAYEKQPALYRRADLCVFASSCENLPIILLEGMASGLPVACSNRGPMPEVLGDAGVYFDPERPGEIAAAIRGLIESPQLRQAKAEMAFQRARQYSWARCADETFAFLAASVGRHTGRH